MSTKKPRGPWARLYAGLINDDKWLDCDRDARLVFLTGIALAKGGTNDGDLSLRAMIGVQYGAMEPAEVEAAAEQLVDLGLWLPPRPDSPGQFTIASYGKWQDTAAEIEAQRVRKVIGAHKTNHGKGQHRTVVDGCPLCHPQPTPSPAPDRDPGRGTGTSPAQDRSAVAGAIAEEQRSARPDQTRPDTDQTPPTPPEPSVDKVDPRELVAIDVADELFGVVSSTVEEAPQQLVWFTARALAGGWAKPDLLDVAWDVYGRALDDPVQYLVGCLRKRAAEPGPNPPADIDLEPMTEDEMLADYYQRFPEEAPTP